MFTKEWIEENLDENTGHNLAVAFATIGNSGIIEAHIQTLLIQATQGYYQEEDASLLQKIRDTRLKVSMMRSLEGFCKIIEIELGDSNETTQN
jgi:hypothetical protein